MKFSRPDFVMTEGAGVIFLDEFAQGVPLVQAAATQFMLDRRIRDHQLGDSWAIIAAGNRAEDRAGANRLITPILNRLIHLDVEVSHEDWLFWAAEQGLAQEVRAFLKWKSAALFAFDPTRNERAFPTPRSWHKVSNILPHIHADRLMPVIAGTVGEARAAEFVGFIKFFRSMPDIELCVSHPGQAAVPHEAAILWSLATVLVDRLRKSPLPELENGITYIRRLPNEFGVLTMRELGVANAQLYRVPAAVKWLAENREFLGVK
jgi:hypothetical protein